jgi:hypothetical protein
MANTGNANTGNSVARVPADSQALDPARSTPHLVRTLDKFVEASAAASGVFIPHLSALSELSVETCNSVYDMLVVDPHGSKVLVRGGRFFPLSTSAVVGGSSLGTSCLKMRWIGEGFCMEIHADGLTVITSPVRAIRLSEPTRRVA